MAHRRRGTYSLPNELMSDPKLVSKKELEHTRKSLPLCRTPVINRCRRSLNGNNNVKPKPVFFDRPVDLDSEYDPNSEISYFAQIFSSYSIIGEGSFGKVFRATCRKDNKIYAIKRMKAGVKTLDRYSEIRNYEKFHDHPNIVHYFMAWEENNELFMLLEHCDISLADFSYFFHEFPEDFLWTILFDSCKALNFLHGQRLIHLDIKPANIMMKNGICKLADFGIMADLKKKPFIVKSLSDGDPKYLAAEVLRGIYTPACDIFGLGISLLELAADVELPRYGGAWHQLRKRILPRIFYDRVSLGFTIIVESMLNPRYEERPSAEKMLKYSTIRAMEKKDRKEPRTDLYAIVKNNRENENMEVVENEVAANANNDPADNNNIIDQDDRSFSTPPCSVRPEVFSQDSPYLDRYEVPGPCLPIYVGKALVFDEKKKTPPKEMPRKLQDSNIVGLAKFASDDKLYEMESDDMDENEKENCDSGKLCTDCSSPMQRPSRSKITKTKLNFD